MTENIFLPEFWKVSAKIWEMKIANTSPTILDKCIFKRPIKEWSPVCHIQYGFYTVWFSFGIDILVSRNRQEKIKIDKKWMRRMQNR